MAIPTLTLGTSVAAQEINLQSTESLFVKSKLGVTGTIPLIAWSAVGGTPSSTIGVYNTTSATSILKGATYSGQYNMPAGSWSDGRTLYVTGQGIAGTTQPGALYRLTASCVYSAGTSVTETVTIGYTPAATGTYVSLATAGALTAAYSTSLECQIVAYYQSSAYSATTGVINAWGSIIFYNATNILGRFPFTANSSIDTTAAFSLDIQCAMSAAATTNSMAINYATLELLN